MSLHVVPDPSREERGGTVRQLREGGVLRVELNSPGTGNAVTEAMLDELLDAFTEPHPDVRAIVLSGAGDAFCLGLDRGEIADMLDEDPTGVGVQVAGVKARRVMDAIINCPAVTVARVQGKAIGAGLALAIACDLRAGADTATFRLPELALGMPIAWGGALPRLLSEVGTARARELILTARVLGAEEACRISLLHRAVPEEELDAAVDAWVRPVLRRSASALRLTKAMFSVYAAPTRLADPTVLDAELLASAVAARHRTRQGT
ncbi:enoyl-CoA hydratase/isomerase family protein [Streptomyces uncialis]|uniref:enoyl-CoA hydratase/isomerase family protein n=1 Tax=Streptomyces uncialis TaxID=1048205 RepID=UPI0037FFFAE7